MAKSEDFEKGYNDAIEAIKKMLAGDKSSGGSGGSGMSLPSMPGDTDDEDGGDSNGNSGYEPKQDTPNQKSDNGEAENDSQGVVEDSDMAGPVGANNPTGDPGGMISKQDGDKICEKEGYDVEEGNDEQVAKDWKEKAVKAASKFKGNDHGNIISQIKNIAKTNTDWKKMLKKITGRGISDDDSEDERFVNKRRLVARGEYARTDKDAESKNSVGYIIAFLDSSGSMSNEMLRKCLREVYTVALAKKPMTLYIIQCDTKIQEIKEYHSVRDLEKDMKTASVKGRGGTDLTPCWKLLKENPKFNKKKTELAMVFTDGYIGEVPARDKATMDNLYWCILDNTDWENTKKDSHTFVSYFNSEDIK